MMPTASSWIDDPPARQSRLICSDNSTRNLAISDLHADTMTGGLRVLTGAGVFG
jgi:hypothetical protein